MGTLEELVRPILLPMIAGQPLSLSPDAQKVLATWASKTAMVAEYLQPRPGMIRQHERSWLKDNLTPPQGWHVWAATYDGSEWGNLTIYQQRTGLDVPAIDDPTIEPHYIEATTFGMGHTLFLVLNTSWDKIWRQFADYDADGLRHIWPTRADAIAWPLPAVLSDNEANIVSNILNWDTENTFDPATYRT